LFGAAAAAGAAARLPERGMRHLLSYTAQQASGVSCWMRDPDHVEKAFDFGGMPARNAVAAATMVASGCTGVDDVFSGERNFFVAFGQNAEPERLTAGLGRIWEILGANIKKWSVGSPIQAALDSLEALLAEHRFGARDVARVTIEVQDHEAAIVNDRDMPDICLQHLAAVMLLDGTVTFASSHDERRMRDRRVLEMRRRIDFRGSAELTRAGGRQAIVEAELTNGRRLRHHTAVVKGTAGNPMSRAEVDAKCHDLVVPILGKRRGRALLDAVWSLERMADVRKLRPLLRA
jgi:2-methylcitrate dehydratase PrpD